MADLLPEVEGWVKVLGAAVAVLMALLVPIRSWIVEDRRYRAQTLEAMAAASRAAGAGATGAATALADTLALSPVAEGLNRVAFALERLRDGSAEEDRLGRALNRYLARHGAPEP